MRKAWYTFICCQCLVLRVASQTDFDFSLSILNLQPPVASRYHLAHPFEIIYGPDDYLYITERVGRVIRVHPVTGIRQILLDHRASTFIRIDRNGSGVATRVAQEGMMGMALHPEFLEGTGQDYIYIAYSYANGRLRISRFTYNNLPVPFLNNEVVLLEDIPSGSDHSTGRLIFGADSHLYYTCGDLGANQWDYKCNEIQSQKLPTAGAISAGNYSRYAGKTLRLQTNGSIPPDNPVFSGVRSHIYSIGHRNAQGLVTEKSATNGSVYPTPAPGARIYSSEHGPRTDDEINIIRSGRNYGWPYIAGYLDNVNYSYAIWATSPNCASTSYADNVVPSGALVRQETDSALTDFEPPITTLHTVCTPLPMAQCNASGSNWMRYPTIAPSSIDYYAVDGGTGIPGWYRSLLVPTLRRGVLYRLALNAAGDGFDSDTIPFFRTYNRYRDLAISRDGQKIFLITDSTGTTSGPSGTGTSMLANPGSIMVYSYVGTLLSTPGRPAEQPAATIASIRYYPNPAKDFVELSIPAEVFTRQMSYQMLDHTGRIRSRGMLTDKNSKLDIRNLENGVYILVLRNGYGLEIGKFKILKHP